MAALLGIWRVIQDYFATPRIIGSHLKLHPLAAIFAVLAGGRNRRNRRRLPRRTDDGFVLHHLAFSCWGANKTRLCIRSGSRCEHIFQSC